MWARQTAEELHDDHEGREGLQKHSQVTMHSGDWSGARLPRSPLAKAGGERRRKGRVQVSLDAMMMPEGPPE